ncbi:hypothetical protein [Listeria grayi]|uniref:hypothetical protein n=1 Tax=Listeria grayi TaxID=1641 RepID=UPI00147280F7|nr:hypothetical protein [Listeria grayi]
MKISQIFDNFTYKWQIFFVRLHEEFIYDQHYSVGSLIYGEVVGYLLISLIRIY